MVALLKYIKGYVRIRVWGLSPERFMNLCSNRDILLWDIEKNEEIYTMCISLRAFYQLRPIARKTGTRVVILQRVGLPFFVPVIRARKFFCIGLILCFFFWVISSLFVWDIECNGNLRITDDVLISFLKDHKIKVGMLQDKLDIEELEKEIRRSFDEVTWTSARLVGTKLIIDLKENDKKPISAVNDNVSGKDLVSEFEGTIVSMIVRNGVPKVSVGDVVTEGALLVEGKIPVYNEDNSVREYQYVNSDADIVIRHTVTHQEALPFDYIVKEYTGRERTGYYIRFDNREFKLKGQKDFLVSDSLIQEHTLHLLEKLDIPLYFGRITYREYYNVEHKYSSDQAKEKLTEKIIEFFKSLEEKGVHIIEKNVRIDTESEQWILTAELTVEEAAGELADTIPEQVQSSVTADFLE